MAFNFTIIGLWAIVFFVILIIFFVTSLILRRVFKSKMKDFVILRTFGLSNSASNHLIELENMIVGFVASITALLASKVLVFILPSIFKHVGYFDYKFIFIYLMFIGLFCYFLGKKLGKKIFKFSVQETLNGGVSRD